MVVAEAGVLLHADEVEVGGCEETLGVGWGIERSAARKAEGGGRDARVRGEGRDWEDCCSEDRGLGLEDLAMGSPAPVGPTRPNNSGPSLT